jgi:hypothetical protein
MSRLRLRPSPGPGKGAGAAAPAAATTLNAPAALVAVEVLTEMLCAPTGAVELIESTS